MVKAKKTKRLFVVATELSDERDVRSWGIPGDFLVEVLVVRKFKLKSRTDKVTGEVEIVIPEAK